MFEQEPGVGRFATVSLHDGGRLNFSTFQEAVLVWEKDLSFSTTSLFFIEQEISGAGELLILLILFVQP